MFLLFGSSLLGFFVVFNHPLGREYIVHPFTAIVTGACGLVMSLFEANVTTAGGILATSTYSINVVDGCNGIYASAILISGVIAFPSSLLNKVRGILFGLIAVFTMNLLRVISLFYLGEHYPDIFSEFHIYVWQPIIILWAIFIWDFWTRQIKEMEESNANAIPA